MHRFYTLLFFLLLLPWGPTIAQTGAESAAVITWTSPCTDQMHCLSPNQCSTAQVLLTTSAWSTCPTAGLQISYRIDLNNNGSLDIQGVNDSVSGLYTAGTHRITWRAADACFNTSTCSYLFTVKDCQAPNILCLNGLTQGIDPPACEETFQASQFITAMSDNCTPTNQLQVGMRITGSGTGFPTATELTFDECDVGINFVTIAVRDAVGNINTCNSYVLVQPNTTGCNCNPDADLYPNGCAVKPNGQKLTNFSVRSRVESTGGVPSPIVRTSNQYFASDSCYRDTVSQLPFGGAYRASITAARFGDYLDGVSTLDLVLISRQILGIQPLPTFYQLYAADVNNSGSVTTLDIVELRKLILGISDTLPVGKSWRVIRPVPSPAQFTSFTAVKDSYQIILPNLQTDMPLNNLQWVGVKMGDVNNSVQLIETEDRAPLFLRYDDRALAAGEMALVPLRLGEGTDLAGWQLALQGNEALEIIAIDGTSDDEYSLLPGHRARALWFHPAGTATPYAAGAPLCSVRVRARTAVRLSEALQLDVAGPAPSAFDATGAARSLQLLPGAPEHDGAQLLAPRPNPMQTETRFGVVAARETTVRLELFDLGGQRVYVQERTVPAGRQDVVLQRADLPRSGMFAYRLTAGGNVLSGRLVL